MGLFHLPVLLYFLLAYPFRYIAEQFHFWDKGIDVLFGDNEIGVFGKGDTDLRFQEVEEGNLIVLLRNLIEQLNHKFFIRPVTFEGLYRIENNEYPIPAIREMLLNALIHQRTWVYLRKFVFMMTKSVFGTMANYRKE